MKISLDWLSDYVDLDGIAADTIADRLTMATAEVEGYETTHRAVTGILVGEVVDVEEISPETSNRVATVACADRRFVTVCGAPNLRPGMKAPFAPPGTSLAGGETVRTCEVAGRQSEGVLCSPHELGMSEFHEGVLEIPASAPAGASLEQWIPATDVIVEVDNKSLTHRPDLWGHFGFARELAAVFDRPLQPPAMVDLGRHDHLPAYPIEIENLDQCPCYSCIELQGLGSNPSPLMIQRRLHALGQRTYNLLVDLTNYIMLELGQPTHAFDSSKLQRVRVAPMGRTGNFTTLDGQTRTMLPDDLMIWNESEPVAIAGVMGGHGSEVDATTTRLLLESANFKGSRVRRTSVRLGLRTEASRRFEKNQPPAIVKSAVARFLHLTEKAGETPEVTYRYSFEGDLKDRSRTLDMTADFLDRKVGEQIPDRTVVSILHSLGFEAERTADGLRVGIPPHRSEQDVSIPDDIVEEVLRVYGYDNVTPRMPSCLLEPLRTNTGLRTDHKARRVLAGAHSFVEVHTYSWMDDTWLEAIGFEPGPCLVVKNPTAQHQSRMRTTLVPNLFALVRQNRSYREQFRLFELGKVYRPQGDNDREEGVSLVGVSFTQRKGISLEDHFRAIKGAVEDVIRVVGGGPLSFHSSDEDQAPWQAAHYWASIRCGDTPVGAIGALTGPVLEMVAATGQAVWFELDLPAVKGSLHPATTYTAPPAFPGSWHDFTIVWPAARGYSELQNVVDAFSHTLVLRREFLYFYKGKGLAKGQASYTFRYWIGSHDRTLSGDDIEGFRQAFLKFLEGKGLQLR